MVTNSNNGPKKRRVSVRGNNLDKILDKSLRDIIGSTGELNQSLIKSIAPYLTPEVIDVIMKKLPAAKQATFITTLVKLVFSYNDSGGDKDGVRDTDDIVKDMMRVVNENKKLLNESNTMRHVRKN
jgi:hypothetical protein